jgi:hypothetical protein
MDRKETMNCCLDFVIEEFRSEWIEIKLELLADSEAQNSLTKINIENMY